MNVFLDTMVYLHCVPIEQIDFRSIFDVNSIAILVPRVTFKELEKHKATHTSSRTRDRAGQVLAFLEACIESDSSVRDGVSIVFIPHMPRVDIEALGLTPEWNDDLLIASVLECKEHNPSDETVLVTHDVGARLTCRHLGIRTFELPEKYRLPPQLDESEKENQRLRRELQKLRTALPKIIVSFADGLAFANLTLKAPRFVDEARIAETLSRLDEEVPELPKKLEESEFLDLSFSTIVSKLSASDLIPDEEIDRYSQERIAYFDQYERYVRAVVKAENVKRRSFRFTIIISNSGSAPADDVTVRLHFPDGFALYTKDDLPPWPKEPRRPAQPRSTLQKLQSDILMPKFTPPQVRLPDFGLLPTSSFSLRNTKGGYEITNHFARIKHGFTKELPELFLIFDSYAGARSFNCDYRVSVANLPEPVQGELHFVIEKEAVGTTLENT